MIRENLSLIRPVLQAKLNRIGLAPAPFPYVALTFSVTNFCNSKCLSCDIWKQYKEKPELRFEELNLVELEKIFKSLGRVYYFNISGGEPFSRQDLPQIIELAVKYLKPKVVHTPTNALYGQRVVDMTRKIMQILPPDVEFTIKPSYDGVGAEHDRVRGISGNYKKLLLVFDGLKELKKEYPNLSVGLGTVISKNNIKDIQMIFDNAKDNLKPDSYINEIAEERSELFNQAESLTPSPEDYIKAASLWTKYQGSTKMGKLTQAFRIVYYDLVFKIMTEKSQVIPCYSGTLNVHLAFNGIVWPCSVLGWEAGMGNIRDFDYDLKKLWRSEGAKKIRSNIHKKKCHCPMAGAAYTNMLCNFRTMMKVFRVLVKKND